MTGVHALHLPPKVAQTVHLLTYASLLILTLFTFAAAPTEALTILYSGEEHGQIGLHGCGAEQIGGLAHRQTLIDTLHFKSEEVLNLHTGNLIDPTDANAEWIYQIGLSAFEAMKIDAVCLGPNELSLPFETLAALHSNHSAVGFVCTNATPRIDTPYLIRKVASVNVAIVSLVSESHALELSTVDLTSPQTALAVLEAEIASRSDAVVVVFHGTHAEADVLAETVPWIDVLIVANEQPTIVKCEGSRCAEKIAMVTNAAQGAALGS